MRTSTLVTITLMTSLLTGCGGQGPGTTPEHAGLTGLVRLGPQCPVAHPGDRCQDRPAIGARVTVATRFPLDSGAGGEVVASTTTDDNGRYRVAVLPGTYVVTAHAGRTCRVMEVRVTAGLYSKADLACDTGIR